MLAYIISPYSYKKAKQIGVEIRQSSNPKKKIDVYKKGKKIASIGAIGYNDYPTYIKKIGKKKAMEKRKNYLARHAHEPKIRFYKGEYVPSPSFFADYILW